MTLRNARRVVAAGFGAAAALTMALGVSGCGGKSQDADDAVVVPAAGENLPTAASPSAAPSSGNAGATAAATASPAKPAVEAKGWGTFKGQVVFGGGPPEQPVLEEKGKAEKDPQYCAKDAPIKSERLIVDGGTKGVKNVLVYFPKPTAVNEETKSSKASTDVVFDQVKCVFEPHVLAVMAGSKITLKSSDEVNHNVNAKLQKNSAFNSTIGPGQKSNFDASEAERGPVPVNCDIHPWMQAWWMVVDNPYFATTDAKGNFEIKNVPAGTQKVVVWQEATGFVTKPSGEDVTIKADDTTSKDWTIDPASVKAAR